MKFLTRGLAATAILATVCVSSFAQKPILPERVMLKAGVLLPSGDDAKDLGRNWLGGGLDYQLNKMDQRIAYSVEALYTEKKGGVEEKMSSLTLTFNRKMRLGEVASARENLPFLSIGLGAQMASVKTTDVDKDKTVGVATVAIGTETAANMQIEAKYIYPLDKVEGCKMDGIFLLLGFKF